MNLQTTTPEHVSGTRLNGDQWARSPGSLLKEHVWPLRGGPLLHTVRSSRGTKYWNSRVLLEPLTVITATIIEYHQRLALSVHRWVINNQVCERF